MWIISLPYAVGDNSIRPYKKPFLRPTEEYSHSTRTRHCVDALHTFKNPPSPRPPITIPVRSFRS